jgi:hypothetical protein
MSFTKITIELPGSPSPESLGANRLTTRGSSAFPGSAITGGGIGVEVATGVGVLVATEVGVAVTVGVAVGTTGDATEVFVGVAVRVGVDV